MCPSSDRKAGPGWRKRWKRFLALGLCALVLAPLITIWLGAPADPKFKGQRLSLILYNAYGVFTPNRHPEMVNWQTIANDALKELGPKASPLLRAWIERKPAPLLEKARALLQKRGINFPYLTADHQGIVERLFFRSPAAAVPVSDAFRWQILNGDERDASRAASLMMWVINSVDERSQTQIADGSLDFATQLLDRFEKDRKDIYALCLVGAILQHTSQPINPDLRDKVVRLGSKARYLDRAVQVIKSMEKGTSGKPSANSGGDAPGA